MNRTVTRQGSIVFQKKHYFHHLLRAGQKVRITPHTAEWNQNNDGLPRLVVTVIESESYLQMVMAHQKENR